MHWYLLFLAGLLEVVWAIGLKYTDGFTRLLPSLATLAAMGLSFWLLSLALRTLPIGTAYAVWVGIGAVGTTIAGMALFGEPASVLRFASVLLVVLGIVGLKLTAMAPPIP
jgi:quaternary ammonium compound-resistance protein SugE